ncbi:MAG TPA: hypothetical protein VI316_07080 [Candidatus Dormibacteraeota bacterium]
MFGTISRWRLKEGVTEQQLAEFVDSMRADRPASAVALVVLRSASDPREMWIAGAFESRAAYDANAASPEQNARFERVRALMEGAPEWHDGDVLAAYHRDQVTTGV